MARSALELAAERARPARVAVSGSLLVWAPDGLPEVAAGDDLATLLIGGARRPRTSHSPTATSSW